MTLMDHCCSADPLHCAMTGGRITPSREKPNVGVGIAVPKSTPMVAPNVAMVRFWMPKAFCHGQVVPPQSR